MVLAGFWCQYLNEDAVASLQYVVQPRHSNQAELIDIVSIEDLASTFSKSFTGEDSATLEPHSAQLIEHTRSVEISA
jgi:hypothetical protein